MPPKDWNDFLREMAKFFRQEFEKRFTTDQISSYPQGILK